VNKIRLCCFIQVNCGFKQTMLTNLHTYRSFLLGLLMFSYAFSIFQKPLLEITHFISHFQEFALAQEKIHTYHTHDGSNHKHDNLSLLEDSLNNEDQPQPSKKKVDLKKKVELVDTSLLFQPIDNPPRIANFLIILPTQIFFIKNPSPPPRLG